MIRDTLPPASLSHVVVVLLRRCRCCSRWCRWRSSCSSSSAQGITSLNLDFFTEMPKPVGEAGGGMANAIVGTLIVTGLGALFAIPIGIMSGIYAVGVRRHAARVGGPVRRRHAERRAVDRHRRVRLRHRRAAVQAVLGARRRPRARHHDDSDHHAHDRGAAAARAGDAARRARWRSGATRARAVFTVVLPAALPGIITGILLALARIAGETAPLLFTAFNNRFFAPTSGSRSRR